MDDDAAPPDTGAASRGLVLIVEDERSIAEIIRLNLARAGFGTHVVGDGVQGLAAARALRPAAVVLDVGLPGLDGIEVCRQLRRSDDWTPIVFVTARDDEVDRIVGLELGADDYVTKPFSPRELVARVANLVRRSGAVRSESGTEVVAGAVTLDPDGRRVRVGGSEVALTATEFDLLAFLMTHPNRVFSRGQLMENVWGHTAFAGARTVDVHIAQVRSKLADASPIRTVRGVGYAVDGPRR